MCYGNKMILGLDISTTTIGIVVLDGEEWVASYPIRLEKYKTLYDKVSIVQQTLISIKQTHPIKDIYIESALKKFRGGMSSASVISLLQRWNGMVSLLLYQVFGIIPIEVPVISARKMLGIKVPKGQKPKPIVMEKIKYLSPEFDKSLSYTKLGNITQYEYDNADAFVIALAGKMGCVEKK